MKFTPEVIAALAVLREHAENDFEHHRLDVLERDLTNPPQGEVIDDTHQRFNGIVYYKENRGHYKINLPIHRTIWSYYHGEIPEGYVVHHIDKNKANNNIKNLQIVTPSEHTLIHCPQKFTRTKKRLQEKICPKCGKSFHPATRKQIYCSLDCRDESKKKRIIKTCPICGRSFNVVPSFVNQICCSRICDSIRRSKPKTKKFCQICGQEFTPPHGHSEIRTCSRHCTAKLAWETRRANKAQKQKV